MKTFTTARLHLRPWTLADLEDAHRLIYADPAVADFYAGGVKPLAQVRELLAETIWVNEHSVDQGWGSWAVDLQEEDRLIGRINLGRPDRAYYHLIDPADPYVPLDTEIGYAFGRAYWGQGLASEACRALIAYAFEELRIPRLVIGADLRNQRSTRMLQRLGFRRSPNHHPEHPGYIHILDNERP